MFSIRSVLRFFCENIVYVGQNVYICLVLDILYSDFVSMKVNESFFLYLQVLDNCCCPIACLIKMKAYQYVTTIDEREKLYPQIRNFQG